MKFEEYLYGEVKKVIDNWSESDIYAISFFVYSNECYEFNGISNFFEFSVGYNTERDCNHAPQYDEERWNFAFWSQNNIGIIEPKEDNEGARLLLEWFKENNVENIGYEDENSMYDENYKYIGKGPNGYYELLQLVSNVACKLQTENSIKDKFGRIPIIVHDYEYPWYIIEATKKANPNGEAADFFESLRILGFI